MNIITFQGDSINFNTSVTISLNIHTAELTEISMRINRKDITPGSWLKLRGHWNLQYDTKAYWLVYTLGLLKLTTEYLSPFFPTSRMYLTAFTFSKGIGYVHRDPCPAGGCGLYLWPEVDFAPNTRNFNWSLEALHVYVGLLCTIVEWQKGLEQKGLYYEGIVNGNRQDSVLELYRRSTVSTFGTRRSSRVSVAAQTEKGQTMRM